MMRGSSYLEFAIGIFDSHQPGVVAHWHYFMEIMRDTLLQHLSRFFFMFYIESSSAAQEK